MFWYAIIWNRNSLPARRTGSPVHISSLPRMAYLTPTFSRMPANALVIFWARWSKLPEHPTQNKTSGASPAATNSATVGTGMYRLILRKAKKIRSLEHQDYYSAMPAVAHMPDFCYLMIYDSFNVSGRRATWDMINLVAWR